MKIVRSSRGVRRSAALFAAASVFTLAAPLFAGKPSSSNAAATATTYSGRAIAFHVDGVTHPEPGPIVIGDTGALPSTGGMLEQHASSVSLYGGALTIDSVDAEVAGVGPQTRAETRLTDYDVHFITSDGEDVYLHADYIGAAASVSLDRSGRAQADTDIVIQGLTVNGRAITVTGAKNQVVDLPEFEVKLVLNEQVSNTGKGSGDIASAAIHFYICECIEGHFGLVSAGISGSGKTPPPDEGECGKITGGGWITDTPSGQKGTFGVSGGIRRGEFWGHLTYVDHGTGMKVQSTAVTGFRVDPTDANARLVSYNVTINGVAGTATVRLVDNGEPGRNDVFAITLSTGYSAGGKLGGSGHGGGNIQLHKCPPGWE